jgi:3-hydroxybutyryl-CoA dehydrogenase
MPGLDDLTVAVVGGGYMGGGIARTFAAHGVATQLVDADPGRTRLLVDALHVEAREHARIGLISADAAAAVTENLRAATSLQSALEGATYVAEAVPERPDVKKDVLGRVSALVAPDTIIGTNTSAIAIRDLAEAVTGPERFLGVHWMNPAPYVPGVELIATEKTALEVVGRVESFHRAIGKVPTVVADAPGFVANRLQFALLREAFRIVEEGGATPAQIDEVVSNSFGYRLPFFGPFAIADIAGIDIYRDSFATMEAAYGDRLSTPALIATMAGDGRFGLKTGSGFYRFDDVSAEDVALHRDRAYAGLARLRDSLGDLQLTEAAMTDEETIA